MYSNERLRALLLALVMISSIFVGSIAFAGSASATLIPSETDAIDVADKNTNVETTLTAAFESEGESAKNFRIRFEDGDGGSSFTNGFAGDTDIDDITIEVDLDDDGELEEPTLDQVTEVSGNSINVRTVEDPNFDDGDVVFITVERFTTPNARDDYDAEIDPEASNDPINTDDSNDQGDKLNIIGIGESTSTETAFNETVITGATEYLEDGSDTKVEVTFESTTDLSASANAEFNIIDRSGVVRVVPTANSEYGNTITYNSGSSDSARVAEIDLETNSDLKGNATINVTGDIFAENTTIDTTSTTVKDGTASTTSAFAGEQVAILDETTLPGGADDVVYTIDQDSEFLVEPSTGPDSRVGTFDTSGLAPGTYNITFEDDTVSDLETLELRQFGFNVTASTTAVDLRESESDATIEATIESNVVNRETELRLFDGDGDEVDNKTVNTGSSRERTVEFDVSDEDEYTIEAEDIDTSVTDSTATISVGEVSGTASFTESVFTEQRGDITEFTVDMSNTDTADVAIGTAAGQSGIGYGADVTVNDTSDDGVVTLQLNTYAPNAGANGDAITLADSDDEITRTGAFTGTATALDAGTYDVNVSVDGEEEDVATLSLLELSADGFTALTGPPENDIEDADATSEFDAFEAAGNLTATSSIASKDIVVHKIEASGLGGAIANARSSGDDDEEAFQALLNTDDVRLNITQTDASTGANQDNKELLVTAISSPGLRGASSDTFGTLENVNVVLDETNDTYYFNFPIVRGGDTLGSSTISDEDEFVANLTLVEGDLFDESVSVTQTFSVNNRSVELDETGESADGNEIITVAAATGQTVTGETNLAPGSEIEVRARATGDDPFLLSQTVDADATREFSATFDFSEQDVGENFTFTTTSGDGGTAELDGELVAQVTETPTETATPEPTATATATPEPTATKTATEEPTATAKPGQPGFGIVVALIAILAAALLLLRRD